MPISVSMGAATSNAGERLESVAKRADAAMYEAKRAYYSLPPRERRGSQKAAA